MEKAILVIDMPENCEACEFSQSRIDNTTRCTRNHDSGNKTPLSSTADWCPLKPINPNLIKALRCLASQDEYNNCYTTKYNRERGDKPKMTCKGILNTIECPYHQEEYDTDFGSDEFLKWLNVFSDMLEGKES